ncbi:MAG: hypothetical protein D4R84_15505 [Rhodocyclaceae bacterium]|nr:MAG: hypothetical protein D4R84_15505 [Rhodocyclaceae bacterium]
MDEFDFESLTQFCAEQFSSFDRSVWIENCPVDRRVIAVTATYLSMTSWYGREEELESIAIEIDAPILNFSRFYLEAKAIGLDLEDFFGAGSTQNRC